MHPRSHYTAAVLAALLVLASPAAMAATHEGEWPEGEYNPFGRLPIRYAIDASAVPSEATRYVEQVHEAFAWWTGGHYARLKWTPEFEHVTDMGAAEITITFVAEEELDCHGRVAAGCAVVHSGSGRTGITVAFLAREAMKTYVEYSWMEHLLRHEIGHALGFNDTGLEGDLMAGHGLPPTSWTLGRPLTKYEIPLTAAACIATIAAVVGLWRAGRGRTGGDEF